MKKHTDRLRKDKTCLNCGAHVERRYCPECGQENIETRDSFFHLVIEFILDFVHFDSGFWKTTRYLLFSPAKLSLEYLEGKRKSHVNPIKLYIFISFVAFFIPAILPDLSDNTKKNEENERADSLNGWTMPIKEYGEVGSLAQLDSIHLSKEEGDRIPEQEYEAYRKMFDQMGNTENLSTKIFTIKPTETTTDTDEESDKQKHSSDDLMNYQIEGYGYVSSPTQLDNIHRSKAPDERISYIQYLKHKFNLTASKNFKDKYARERMQDFMMHNLPKTLFVYMPIFAFWMWLFFINRRKFYFDSGIYTLHFFSFVLLLITLYNLLSFVLTNWLKFLSFIDDFLLPTAGIIYVTYYFFKANRVFYADSKRATRWKSIALFFIHNLFILIIFIGYLIFVVTKNYA